MAEKRRQITKIVEVPSVDQYGHKQPQSLDMEVAVIGALMVEQEAWGQVAELLKPESFYDKRHQLIYQAIQTLNVEQRPVDIMTVCDELEHTGNLEDAGGELLLRFSQAEDLLTAAGVTYESLGFTGM